MRPCPFLSCFVNTRLWIFTALLVLLSAPLGFAQGRIADGLLRELNKQKRNKGTTAISSHSPFLQVNRAGRWLVYFHYAAGANRDQMKQELARRGAAGVQDCLQLNVMQAWIKPDQLENLSTAPGVTFVGLARRGFTREGEVLSQGDYVLRSNQARELKGATGQGVRVGVISDGVVNNDLSKLTGDLPTDLYVRPPVTKVEVITSETQELVAEVITVTSGTQPNLFTVELTILTTQTVIKTTTITTVLEGGVGDGDEGTAMAEIVHDLAPDATLGFAPGIMSDVEFINAINDLADNFKADIIVDDLGFYSDPVYEAGPIATAAQRAVMFKGIRFFSAAGNDADVHYESAFNPIAGPVALPGVAGAVHNFANGDKLMDLGSARSGDYVGLIMHYNSPFDNPTSRYRMHLYNMQNLNQGPIASSANMSEYWFDHVVAGEILEFQVPYSGGGQTVHMPLGLAVERYVGNADRFTIFNLPQGFEHSTGQGADSIWGHPGVPEVNGVGAAFWGTPDTLESFSSQGPSTVQFPFFVRRSKPDFVAVDGVSITGVGGFPNPFYGTSAAAPHAAAVGAQVLSVAPWLTPPQLQEVLQKGAIPMNGQKGFSYATGWGRVDALGAIAAIQKGAASDWAAYE